MSIVLALQLVQHRIAVLPLAVWRGRSVPVSLVAAAAVVVVVVGGVSSCVAVAAARSRTRPAVGLARISFEEGGAGVALV